jgi:hypothetical protein
MHVGLFNNLIVLSQSKWIKDGRQGRVAMDTNYDHSIVHARNSYSCSNNFKTGVVCNNYLILR